MLNTNESGRSMVEMLGVLAIIGVLSIGGIAGYTQAMRAYRANEAINAASMLYTAALTRNGGIGEANVTYEGNFGFSNPSGVNSIKSVAASGGNGLDIEIEFADSADCTAVANKVGSSGAIRATCAGSKATMTFNNAASSAS